MPPKRQAKTETNFVESLTGDILSRVSASDICNGAERSPNMKKEALLSAYIEKNPSAADLPDDAVVVGYEVACRTDPGKQPKKLDLLMYSKKSTLLYAVELQADKGDSSHTNRAIFYTKKIKQQLEDIVDRNSDLFEGSDLTDKNVVGVLVCEETPEEFDTDIADDNDLIVVLVPFLRGKKSDDIFTLSPQIVVGSMKMLQGISNAKVSSGSSMEWHKPRAKNFFNDAGGMKIFRGEFQPTKGGNAISARVRFVGKKCTVGFWCNRGQGWRQENQVYLYNVPREIFQAWDALGINYKPGKEQQVVRLHAPGIVAPGNQGLVIQLNGSNRTVWAKHFAKAVQWVNKNRGRRS